MATLERAQGYFNDELRYLKQLCGDLYASSAAVDALPALNVYSAAPKAPEMKLVVLLIEEATPAWSAVDDILQRIWPKTDTKKGGRLTPEKISLGRHGLVTVVRALEHSEKPTIDDIDAAEKWCVLLSEALASLSERFLVPKPAQQQVQAPPPNQPAANREALPPSPRPKPAAAAPAPVATPLPTPPAERQEVPLPFGLPPSRSATAEPVQSPPRRFPQPEATSPQEDLLAGADFGGGFDDVEQPLQLGGIALAAIAPQTTPGLGPEEEDPLTDLEVSDEDSDAPRIVSGGRKRRVENREPEDASDDEPVIQRKRGLAGGKGSPQAKKSRRIVESSDEEGDDEQEQAEVARQLELAPRNASSGPSNPRRSAPSPSPAPKPGTPAPSTYINFFDPTTFNEPVCPVPLSVSSFLPTGYLRQPPPELKARDGFSREGFPSFSGPLTLSHSDIGGGNAGSVGRHLCITDEQNALPTSVGQPFAVAFSSAAKRIKVRARLREEASGAISLFASRKGKVAWFYYGEVREVTGKIRTLRGGAAFTSLAKDEQDQWITFVDRRLNLGTRKQRDKALQAAADEWNLRLQPGATDASSIGQALRTDPDIEVEFSIWRCVSFDEEKVAEWQAAVDKRERFAKMLAGTEAPSQAFLLACEEAAAKAKGKKKD